VNGQNARGHNVPEQNVPTHCLLGPASSEQQQTKSDDPIEIRN